MDNDTQVVDNTQTDDVEIVETAVPKGSTHLVVTISQDTYDKILELRDVAESRGLNSDFTFWLETQAVKHAKVTLDLWRKSDDAQILQRAMKGSSQAKLAVLTSLYGKDVAAKMLAALPTKR